MLEPPLHANVLTREPLVPELPLTLGLSLSAAACSAVAASWASSFWSAASSLARVFASFAAFTSRSVTEICCSMVVADELELLDDEMPEMLIPRENGEDQRG